MTTRLLRAAGGALLACLAAGCERPAQTAAASAAPASAAPVTAAAPAAGASASVELVYERVIGGNQDLYVLPAGGGVERRLTQDPATDGLPRWSRDGRSVYFTSDRSGNWQIWEVPAEGGEARRTRTNGWREWQIDPSPNGRWLAFLSNKDGPEYLFVTKLRTGEERVLARHGKNSVLGNPSWSSDGKRIVFSSNWKIGHQIYLVDVESGEERRLSAFRKGGCEPRFHPDGRRVVYVSRGHLSEKSRLVEHDLETEQERVLVDWPALNYDPVYSPDGSELAFASNITGDYVIYRQRLADGKSWRVTFGPGSARYPDYRPASR